MELSLIKFKRKKLIEKVWKNYDGVILNARELVVKFENEEQKACVEKYEEFNSVTNEEAILPLIKSILGIIGDQIHDKMSKTSNVTNTRTNNTDIHYDNNVTVENGNKKKAKSMASEITKFLDKRGG